MLGRLDLPLSPLGERQAVATAQHLQDRPCDALWCSPLARARMTADAIGEAMGQPVVVDRRLIEVDVGRVDGMHIPSLPDELLPWRARWQEKPGTTRFPGGETLPEVSARTWRALEDLYDLYPDGDVIVVSHMFAISTLLTRVFSLKVGKFRTFAIDPCSITTVQIDPKGFRLLGSNDTCHLAGIRVGG